MVSKSLDQWLEACEPLLQLAQEKYPQYLDYAWGRYNIIQLRSLGRAVRAQKDFRAHPCWKGQYAACCAGGWGRCLFSRSPQVRFMRRVYALGAFLCPDLAAAYVRHSRPQRAASSRASEH